MTDQPRHPGTGDNTSTGSDRESPPRMPRWVWMSAIVLGVLILLAVVVMLVGGGQHSPARHTSSGGVSVPGVTARSDVPGNATLASAHG
jgi:hypothetical protein